MRKQLAYVGIATLLAQIAAFTKMWFVARYFGVGAELDGYYLAFIIPSLISGVLSGAIQTGLFPVYARIRTQQGDDAAWKLARLLMGGIVCVSGCISLLLLFTSQMIASLLAHGASSSVLEATIFTLPFAALSIALNGAGDYLGYLLALRGRYTIAAAAPIANAAVGTTLLISWPEGGLLNLTLGTLLGLVVQVGIVLRTTQQTGFRVMGELPSWSEARVDVKEIIKLGGWILPGVVFSNISIAIPTVLIASYGEGAISAFGYAFRFHQSAVQLLVMAASPVILAHFSELVVQDKTAQLRRLLRHGIVTAFIVGIVAFGLVSIWGEPLLLAVFGHGRFDLQAAHRVANHWMLLTVALFPTLWGNVLTKFFQANRNPGLLSVFGILGLLVIWSMTWIFARYLGEYAIPAAIAISAYTVAILAWRLMHGFMIRKIKTAETCSPGTK
jgi:murein biosynthesis integral membrane protein MurJ